MPPSEPVNQHILFNHINFAVYDLLLDSNLEPFFDLFVETERKKNKKSLLIAGTCKELIMKRYFYLSEDLNDVQALQEALVDKGIKLDQLHVLTNNDSEASHRKLHTVHSLLKKDVIRSGFYGAIIGLVLAFSTLVLAYAMGWTASSVGWVPFVFLAIVFFGFCTWEGGFLGFQQPHYQFRQLNAALQKGNHALYVDLEDDQRELVESIIRSRQTVRKVSEAEGEPGWFVAWRSGWRSFIKTMP